MSRRSSTRAYKDASISKTVRKNNQHLLTNTRNAWVTSLMHNVFRARVCVCVCTIRSRERKNRPLMIDNETDTREKSVVTCDIGLSGFNYVKVIKILRVRVFVWNCAGHVKMLKFCQRSRYVMDVKIKIVRKPTIGNTGVRDGGNGFFLFFFVTPFSLGQLIKQKIVIVVPINNIIIIGDAAPQQH